MALVYLGYLREDESLPLTAQERSEFVTRRFVSLGLALVVLVVLGLTLGPIAVIAAAVAAGAWWAFATRADRRRNAAALAKRPDA